MAEPTEHSSPIADGKPAISVGLPGARKHLRGTGGQRRAGHGGGESFFRPLPLWLWIGAGVLTLWGATSANPKLSVFAILMLPVLMSLLWLRDEPPVLLFACGMQWLEAAIGVFLWPFAGKGLWRAGDDASLRVESVGCVGAGAGHETSANQTQSRQRQRGMAGISALETGTLFILYFVAFVFFSLV